MRIIKVKFVTVMVGALALTACNSSEADNADYTVEGAAMKGASPVSQSMTTNNDAPPAGQSPALAVEAEGLRLFNPQTGSARPIAFGSPRQQVLAALEFRGAPGTGTNSECGAGPLVYANWPDGLGLYFQDEKFVGWNLDQRGADALTTASGIGPGSTRAELEAAYSTKISETTLGTEFAAGEIFGILEGKGGAAKITNMWSGTSCNFR